jgi:hypothetical protein
MWSGAVDHGADVIGYAQGVNKGAGPSCLAVVIRRLLHKTSPAVSSIK